MGAGFPLCPCDLDSEEMAVDLGELVKFCIGLSSGRQTERKTSAIKLIERLKDPEVQSAIDESGKKKRKTGLCWDSILYAIFEYVICEADVLQNSSKLADDTLSRKKKDISETFRTAIQLAERRGPTLKAVNVYDHIWHVMSNQAMKNWFCNEYTNVLVKNFLTVEVHKWEITPKLWHDFVRIYCNCIMKPPIRGDISIFAQALNLLTSISGHLSNVRGFELFNLFRKVFKDIRDCRNETYLSFIVGALNTFSLHFAADNRGQLCMLGEDLIPLLLPLWNRTSKVVKGKLIDFFRIQMDIHHPCGAHSEDEGAWSSNEDDWTKCLAKLQEAIRSEFQHLAGKIKLAGRVDLAQSSNFVELAVATYHQVFHLQKQKEVYIVENFAEATTNRLFFESIRKTSLVISRNNTPNLPTSSSRKKQRTESDWQPIIDGISLVSSPTACVAWLQFFKAFINRHPTSFPRSEYLPFLSCLYQAMIHCKRSDVSGFIIRALQSLADSPIITREENPLQCYNSKEIDSTWRSIWFETLKSIHSRKINGFGFKLLTSILRAGLYTPTKDAYNIFFSSGMEMTRDSLVFLITLLQRYPVPDKLNVNMEIYRDYDKPIKYLTRRKIIELVLPEFDASAGRQVFARKIAEMTKESTQQSALVITCALQKERFTVPEKLESMCTSHSFPDDYEIRMKKIEELYIKSSFCAVLSSFDRGEKVRLKSSKSYRIGLIPELCPFLLERCVRLKDTLISLHKDEEFCKSSVYLCDWLDIICRFLSIFQTTLFILMYAPDNFPDHLRSGLTEIIKILIKTATAIIPRLYKSTDIEEDARDTSILSLFQHMNFLFEMIHDLQFPHEQFLALFPNSFMDMVFNITSDQFSEPPKSSSRLQISDFGSSGSSSTTIGDFDELMQPSDGGYTHWPISNQDQTKANHDDASDFSKSESIRAEASKLCCIFAFVQQPLHYVKDRSLKDSILDYLDELETVINHVSCYSVTMTPGDLEVLFECIRKYISDRRSSQTACEAALRLLRPIIKFLKAPDEASEDQFEQVRLIAMKVMSAIWSLREDKYCPAVRLMLANCLVEVLEVDPGGTWSNMEITKQSKKAEPNSKTTVTIEDCLLKLLTDKSHFVRMKAADYVRNLFQSSSNSPAAPSQQQKVFDKVADSLSDLVVIKENFTEYEVEDVSANRGTTLLYTLKRVACSSSICEKRAIALLFQDYKERLLDMKLVGKVFREIACEKGFKDSTEYLKEHLGFICNDWMKKSFSMVDFPSIVVQMDIKDFLRAFSREIIPYIMLYRDKTCFDKMKEKLELKDPWTELVINNFDRIVVFMLPFYALQSKRIHQGLEDENIVQEIEAEKQKAKLAYEFLENTLTKEIIDKLLVKRFDDIVIELFLRMFDPPSEGSDASQFMREVDAAPNPPYFTSYAIRGTLEYLATCHNNRSILEVLSLKKDSIQKILLALATSVTNSKTEREKVRLLCSYRLFVLLLLDDLENGLGMNWAYFVRDVVYRCCHWLNWHFYYGNDNAFFLCVYHVLHKLTEKSLASCSEEFGCHIVIIVNTLMKFAKQNGDLGKRALSLIKFIVLENFKVIQSSLVDLPPFPDAPAFSELSKKLAALKRENDTRDNFDDLKILNQQEFMSVEVLNNFLQMLKHDRGLIQRFLEVRDDGSKKLLEIISRLMELAAIYDKNEGKDPDKEMRLAIGRCIGEIGPVDFHSLALPLAEGYLVKEHEEFFALNKSAYCHHLVLNGLCSLLIHESMDIVSAAATALKDALHTRPGIQFLNVYDVGQEEKPKFFLYSQPFKPSKNKKGPLPYHVSHGNATASVNNFLAHSGKAHLWDPGLLKYDEWIKELSSSLISSGALQDEILLQCAAVCKLDVLGTFRVWVEGVIVQLIIMYHLYQWKSLKAHFAALILPLLVHNILLTCNDEIKSMLSSLVNRFVSQYLTKQQGSPLTNQGKASPNQNSSQIGDKEQSARTLISVVNYLRKQDKPLQSARAVNTKWDNNFWLDINYFDLAQMAFECSSYFAAVMFTEIWCDIQRLNSVSLFESEESCASSQATQLEALSAHSGNSEVKTSCQRLLFEAYRSIGEPDAVYGVGTGYSSDVITRVKAYEYEGEFSKALLTQDLHVDTQGATTSLALAQNLERTGLNQALFTFMNGIDRDLVDDRKAFEELQFEACWRNGVWDLEMHLGSSYEETTISGAIFESIVALKEGDLHVFQNIIDDARINFLTSNGIEGNVSTSTLYDFLSKMNAITELEAYGKEYFSKDILPGTAKCTLANDFKYYELALSVKAAAFKASLQREVQKSSDEVSINEDIAREAYSHILRSAVLAREAGRFQICERYLHDISSLAKFVEIPLDWKIEQARMFWDRGEKNRAMYHLKTLIKNCEKGKDPNVTDLYPSALGIYGHWLAESQSENPGVIIEDYMEYAACLLEDSQCTSPETPSEAYYLLAKYADSQYEGIKEYIKSAAFENKQSVIKKVKDEIKRLNETGNANTSNRYYRSLAIQCDEDEKELQRILQDRKQFLQKALENYVRCLSIGDKYDLKIFRLCSLWLDNAHEVFVDQMIKTCLTKVQSRKFIPLMYQLAARLGVSRSKENKLFNDTLEQLIEKAAKEHPFHVTIIIMALCNVEESSNVPKHSASTLRRSKLSNKDAKANESGTDKSRVQSAKAILAKLKQVNPSLIESMEVVMNAYMELAYHDIQQLKRKTGLFELPSKLLLRRVKDFKNFPVPTMDIPVDPSCDYRNITYIASFDSKFTHCGGINLPKVVTCIGSDGKRRKQLVKGKDDLRQDAVMQQVFGMVNQLLKENSETRKRDLRIKTYKVVPLSQRSGIVEWCENTVPLGEYLIGTRGIGGAHSRYHPTDWTAAECRKKITDAANSNGKVSRFAVFQEMLKHFRPVFRHFFYEKFTDPVEWFTKRLAYTRSLASSSIVGYVVGLGDRHVQNILVDFITAELVHIDLGIAFEQGKQLPTPETVPFRLTRDLVDGMGVTGVEGVFRRCCEKVMELMRSSQEAILTIVEVLLYDPLYVWTLSPLKAVQVQQKTTDYVSDTLQNMTANGDDNIDTLLEELQSVQPQPDHSKNKMAQRVLIRLKQKLDGNEAGTFLSTEGQVNFLIQAARDPKNLCRVFPGWQPWI